MGRVARQTRIYDQDTDQTIRMSVNYGTQNGDGWVILYQDAYMRLLCETSNPSILRIFGSLMAKQTFDVGINTTKKAIYEELGIERTSAWKAFKWLKENLYIKERKVNGQTQFLLNPYVTTCGKNRKKKIELWESI